MQRWNMLHPEETPRVPYVSQMLADAGGPVIASTDYMKLYADQIREFIPSSYTVLGTDGFGRSDTRSKLRRFFEVSREYIVVAALFTLAEDGLVERSLVSKALDELNIDRDKADPFTL